jgi:hypothetical protein
MEKRIPMNDTHPLSGPNIPDPDIGRLTRSIRALFSAILTRALKDIFKPSYSDHEIYKTQALHWMAVDDHSSITSFISICSYLDIDASRIRHKVNTELSRIVCNMPHQPNINLGRTNYGLNAQETAL